MKRALLILIFCLTTLSASSYTTDASKFSEEQYSLNNNCNVKIKVIKEYTNEYQQQIGERIVPAITYGYGYIKGKDRKKCKITYICLLDENCKPFWSYIVPYK